MQVVFALTSARSGTTFLRQIINRNGVNCISKHEPVPDMFGRSIAWHADGDMDRVRRLFAWKRRRINGCGAEVYVETNHAFLKSFAAVAMEAYPGMKLVHMLRDPLKVAKSEQIRQQWGDGLHVPLRYVRDADGQMRFRWNFTGREPLFRAVGGETLSPIQFYVLQWIEIENRAMQFLDDYEKHDDCFRLEAPQDLNSQELLGRLFDFLGIRRRDGALDLRARRNRNNQPTVITDKDREEYAAVLARVPDEHLAIFRDAPYADRPWAEPLKRRAPRREGVIA
jgi:hypothetical protein